ncbi:LLM class F420-dependent oxidoreductase [Nocardia mangyaensis]|uniref:LLM class F420-dependent oxidoreductase n=1 Tax=Nocardia mangyaensis TaxID=2213200 RepID=A0A1J0VRN1_9NOCA|nr:LLM class F420-dependent oxidoreductase [Nocardia mangyaensis]APE34673.1 LLM class F420-dependent oxidoreductase [Nocardia mangyaensis]
MTKVVGRYGVWRGYKGFTPQAAREIEELGFGALWLGGSPPADLPEVESLLEATDSLTVGTSIVNIWTAPADAVAESFHRIEQRFPGRFLLGIGVGHREANGADAIKPYDALVRYLDELDAAGVPKESRALAALGPRVLKLAAERTAGALPYLAPPEHTRIAHEVLGADALLVAEQKVVVDDDPDRARAIARQMVPMYLGLVNYVSNLRRLGFSEEDLATPGSDRLIDVLAVNGTPAEIAAGLAEHVAAGADHVAIQVLNEDYLEALRTVATALPLER